MDTSKTTARPWRALRWWESAGMALADASDDEERAEWARCKVVRIEGANGETVCAAHDLAEIEPDDAALIVRAVNSHEALVAALREMEREFGVGDGRACGIPLEECYPCRRKVAIVTQARAALALAEQGGG